jgi:hypothetical protein
MVQDCHFKFVSRSTLKHCHIGPTGPHYKETFNASIVQPIYHNLSELDRLLESCGADYSADSVYSSWPQCKTLITQDRRPLVVEALLMYIFMMR